ncbi:MAG: hypothetical protein QM589_04745 [Thermomicrobiales bacterium]
MHSSLALAYQGDFGGHTYFDNVEIVNNGDNVSWLKNADGSSSGYVMPNRQSTLAGLGDPGRGGAVGTNALGYDGPDNTTRKRKLFELLQRANRGTELWDKMGSAFVVHQMLGKKQTDDGWGDAARTITPTEWDDLEKRLVNNANLTMVLDPRFNVIGAKNTAAIVHQGKLDIVDFTITGKSTYLSGYQDPGYEYAWVFRENGTTRYVLEVNCANPIGDFGGFLGTQYDLNPTASPDKSIVEPGDVVTVTNTVTNEGKDPSGPTSWRLTEMVFGPRATLSADDKKRRDNDLDPCASRSGAFPSDGRIRCRTSPGQEKTNTVFNPGSPAASSYVYTIPPDTPVGTRICFTASITPPTQAARRDTWRHSALQCVIVAKKPKMQVWGGDVRAGGTIDTSTSTIGGMIYGSWGEYAALSNGQNTGFGSGSGLNGGNANTAQSGWSSLTFANTNEASVCAFGCYGFTLSGSSLAAQFAGGAIGSLQGSVDINTIVPGRYTAHDLTLIGTTLDVGKSIIIMADDPITIAGNIVYRDGPYRSARELPQVVLHAPTINIQGNVERVDAWLFAITDDQKGLLNTCVDTIAPGDFRLTTTICNTPLVVNGPVVADKISLRRTAGSDGPTASRGNPAEVFNLRADAYLWRSSYGSGQNTARTVYTKELPPRY